MSCSAAQPQPNDRGRMQAFVAGLALCRAVLHEDWWVGRPCWSGFPPSSGKVLTYSPEKARCVGTKPRWHHDPVWLRNRAVASVPISCPPCALSVTPLNVESWTLDVERSRSAYRQAFPVDNARNSVSETPCLSPCRSPKQIRAATLWRIRLL